MSKKIMGIYEGRGSEAYVEQGDTVEDVIRGLREIDDDIAFGDIAFFFVERIEVIEKVEYIVNS